MHILLLTNFYPPEIRSISTMMRELAEGLVARGHHVTVVTSWPKENMSPAAEPGRFLRDSQEGSVRVVRVKLPSSYSRNYVLRGLAQLTMPYFFWRAIRRLRYPRIDSVIVYTPHLPLALVGGRVKKIYGSRYLLNVQDIFPQNAIDLGILKNPLLIRFYEWLERRAYAAADAMTTHTNGGREFLIQKKHVPAEKIRTVYNWIDPKTFEGEPTGEFRQRYGLQGKFIMLFAGIFGPSQGLEFVIEVATRVLDLPQVQFLLVGEGTEKQHLEDYARSRGATNIHFHPFVPPREYPALLKDVDVGLLCLSSSNTTAVVPGKLFGYMAAGLPVVAFLQKQSEGHRIVSEAGCGVAVVSNSVDQAAAAVRTIFQNRATLSQQGARGQVYAFTHFSKQRCIDAVSRLAVGH